MDKDFKQKCDACHFNSDRDKLKKYNIKEQLDSCKIKYIEEEKTRRGSPR